MIELQDIGGGKAPKNGAAKKILSRIKSIDSDEKEGLDALPSLYPENAERKTPSIFKAEKTEAQSAAENAPVFRKEEEALKTGAALETPSVFETAKKENAPETGECPASIFDAETEKTEEDGETGQPPGAPQTRRTEEGKTTTGIRGLDDLLEGGIPTGSLVLLRGATGSGKTIFATQFIANGADIGEPGVFLSLAEPAESIRKSAALLGLDLEEKQRRGKLAVISRETRGNDFSRAFGGEAHYAAKNLGARRIAVDALSPPDGAEGDEWKAAAAELCRKLHGLGATAVVTITAPEDAGPLGIEHLFDGEILLRKTGGARMLEIRKMRRTSHDFAPHEYTIGNDGISILY